MFSTTFILALVVGWLRGGRLAGLATARFKGGVVLFLGIGLRFLLYWGAPILDHFWPLAVGMQIVAHGLLLAGVWLNRDLTGFYSIAGGLLANFGVILANGGRMPVAREALVASGQEHLTPYLATGQSVTHVLLGPDSRLPWLADIFALPAWWPLAVAFSVGDVLIALGAFLFIQDRMLAGAPRAARARR